MSHREAAKNGLARRKIKTSSRLRSKLKIKRFTCGHIKYKEVICIVPWLGDDGIVGHMIAIIHQWGAFLKRGNSPEQTNFKICTAFGLRQNGY